NSQFTSQHRSPRLEPRSEKTVFCPLAHPNYFRLRGQTPHCRTVPLPLPRQAVQRGGFALIGLSKFHSISLCGRLYPLPRRTTFHLRNALHLIEARDSVAYVRGIFQRLLALLGESELGCGYPITSWLGQLCHCFLPREHPLAHDLTQDFLPRITATFPVPAAWCG